ncbi:YheC/YheD family endospore coat-associated protein [Alicyclobacillus cellulosilyticus]|nr:YheC/YheD family protein [Alicyclobacillus cellulosilyticus]
MVEVVVDPVLTGREARLDGQAAAKIPKWLTFAGRTAEIDCARAPAAPIAPRAAFPVSSGREMDAATPRLFISPAVGAALGVPARLRLRTRTDGTGWQLGPCFGIYACPSPSPGRLFGEQTRMFQDLAVLSAARGIDLVVVGPGFSQLRRGWRFDPEQGVWHESVVGLPDLVIRRAGVFPCHVRRLARKELSCLRRAGRLHTLPWRCSDKWYLQRWLRSLPDLAPYLLPATRTRDAEEVYRLVHVWRDVYVKPVHGSQGRSIVRLSVHRDGVLARWHGRCGRGARTVSLLPRAHLLRTRRDVRRFFRAMGLGTCLVQQTFLLPRTEDGRPFDFRWLVQQTGTRWVVAARVARVGLPGAVTTNIHTGAQAKDAEVLLQARWGHDASRLRTALDEVALTTAERLAVAFGPFAEVGIDLAVAPDGRIALFEVNPTPGRRMLRSLAGDVRTMSLAYLLEYVSRATGFIDP